jgi:hypothetical protein
LLAWQEEYGITHPLFTDVKDDIGNFVRANEEPGVRPGMPYTALIDRGMRIVSVVEDENTIEDAVALL